MKNKNVLTNAGGGGTAEQAISRGFTMAEILLSLTIIGVVAAITLPSLTGNINERTWNTQRKALYARFSQAIALMPALNGYGTLDATTDTAAETFITDGLAKVLKINNICDNDHLADCGIPDKIITIDGASSLLRDTNLKTLVNYNSAFQVSYVASDGTSFKYSQPDTKSAAFETANGESIIVFYNPNCKASMGENSYYYSQTKMCANFVYDLNGSKGPNTVGKDIGFISVLYPTDSVVVAPVPVKRMQKSNHYDLAKTCREIESESRVANVHEAMSMFYNRDLLNFQKDIWTSTIYNGDLSRAWLVNSFLGYVQHWPRNTEMYVLCVKR